MEDNIEWAYAQLKDTRHHNFLTGPAGSGKSTLIRRFIEEHKHETLVCASTGIAAVNVGGVTIHKLFSFPIIPIGYKQIKFLDPINRPSDAEKFALLNAAKYIIIDEISMVRADVMDQIAWYLKKNFEKYGHFGGKKIIMVGDINQLPPVVASEQDIEMMKRRGYKSPYFFDAACWDKSRYTSFKTIRLTKVWRQSDSVFIDFLNTIKDNNISNFDIDRLNARCLNALSDNGGVLLCATNKIADETNAKKLEQVNQTPVFCDGEITGDFPEKYMPVSWHIELKKGCRIMTCMNDRDKHFQKFVNGSIGTFIERINDENGDRLIVKFDNMEDTVAVPKYTFENIDYAYDETTGSVKSKIIGRFTQFPVKLAYALTVHKSQGQSFDKIIVDLGEKGAFAHGQAYVALSRCRTIEGIILRRPLRRSDFIYDNTVLEFNKRMEEFV